MTNEMIFFIEISAIIVFVLVALKLGKDALVTWVSIQAIIANLFILKQISLFGLDVTASDAFAIGSVLGLNFLQEYFGDQESKKAIWICFFFMLFFALVSQLHLLYQSSSFDRAHASYEIILSPAPRLLFASISIFFLVQQIDIRFFAFLKNYFPQWGFATRVGISLVISQFLDTFLFSFVGLYGIVASVFDIIVVSFSVKLIVIFFITPFLKLTKA